MVHQSDYPVQSSPVFKTMVENQNSGVSGGFLASLLIDI
uniref:Uncharacterized protein n=1 Tax=Rhizophora mucronata TaxID=61149 RepID=A0A2P2Q1B0_RHIMU